MSILTESEIMTLLDSKDPSEILAEKQDQLDDAGKALLAELAKDIQSGQDMFEEFGRQFREADDMERSSSKEIDKRSTSIVEKPAVATLKRRSVNVPHWALAAAAVFASIAILPNLLDLGWGDFEQTRGPAIKLQDLGPSEDKIVTGLLERADNLYTLGKAEKNREYLKEAVIDLLYAYRFEPKNAALLSLLARVYETIGEEKKSDRYFEEWKAAKAQKEKNEQENP